MAERMNHNELVDLYVRDELTPQQEAEFEEALLESPELQAEVEAVLAIQQALQREDAGESQMPTMAEDTLAGASNWQPFALAASVLLAVFSTTMYWKIGNDSINIQRELDKLRQPNTEVLMVSLDIMRSSGNQPDAVIQKPASNALLMLDIELNSQGRSQDQIQASFATDAGESVLSWVSPVRHQSVVSVGIYSDQIPDGRLWLELSDPEGQVFDRRLLEFLPALSAP